MNSNTRFLRLFITLLTISVMLSCSQESNSVVSKFWHNMTARYNAYYLAKERMKLVEDKIWENQKDDYNRILEIFPLIDTNLSTTLKPDLDYIFERASITPTKHKNSNWVDDSYILIGKLKLYENKLDSGIFAFKYVNTKSKDEQTRYSSLVWLLRTYLLNGEMKFARDVHTYLDNQKLNSKNKRDFYLASAQFYKVNENLKETANRLKKALPHIKRDSDYKSRIHYIIGQILQKHHQPDSAYYHYSQTLKKNPPYDLSFFAKLNMSQVSSPTEEKEIKKIRHYFDKMLVDLKNTEFKDRIYYDMAQFELKQGNRDTAITYLNKSIQTLGGVTPHMKAYSYLSLGNIYYNHPSMAKLKKYTLAKTYYDSTVAEMDTLFENHDFIVERDKVLSNFVDQIETIEREDSLQRLGKMDNESLSAYLDEVKQLEEERLKQEAIKEDARQKKKKREEAKAAFSSQNAFSNNSSFVFYNRQELLLSNIKFKEKWGERKLEDNWRRSTKDFIINDEPLSDSTSIDTTATVKVDTLPKINALDEKIAAINVNKEELYKDIPKTPADFALSDEKLTKAYYLLGKIYDQNLEETDNAIITFLELQKRFPENEFTTEVYYFLYLLCPKSEICNESDYENILLNKYPSSLYANLIKNPDYLTETKLSNKTVHELYEKAFNHYHQGNYLTAQKEVSNIMIQYPHNDIPDKLNFLKTLTYAKTDKLAQYKSGLINFILTYKNSDIVPYATELLTAINLKGNAIYAVKDSTFSNHKDTTQYFIAFFQENEIGYKKNLKQFYEFHQTYYRDSTFSTRRIDFDSTYYAIVIKSLSNRKNAKTYLEKLIHWNKFSDHYKDMTYHYYIIDPQNYDVLSRRKNRDEYSTFYKKNYR